MDPTREATPLHTLKSVRCPHCRRDVKVERGLLAAEALWLHEYDCEAIVLAAPSD